jgi:asparagine synthase (glutamine-hydrolysing)
MCGVAGYYSKTASADPAALGRMLSAIAHRGPDQIRGTVNGRVAVGSARLAILNLDGGLQPAVSPDRNIVIAFNGEIFNYRTLLAELGRKGVALGGDAEIDLLQAGYLHYGFDLFARLDGQFAIAIWDGRTERMILARDRVGIRPLFWFDNAQHFGFASEMKSLFASKLIPAQLDPAAIIQTMRFWTCVGEQTAFRGVRQVPPAHFLVATRSEITLHRYWAWPLPHTVDPIELKSDEDYFELFRDELTSAVERQSISSVPVGSYMSGGIDSVTMAMLLQKQVGNRLETFSVRFADTNFDESEAQRTTIDHFGFRSNSITVGDDDIGDNFPAAVWHAETPLFRSAPVPLFLLSRQVHRQGYKVVMTGEGADEIALGYDLFKETRIREFWGRQPDSRWRSALIRRLYHHLPQYRNPRFLNLLVDFYRPFLKGSEDRHFAMQVRWEAGRSLERYLAPEHRAFAQSYDATAELDRWLPADFDKAGPIERAQWVEMQTLLSNYLLSSQGDRMSLAHAVEGRYPYLDTSFIELCARLPRRLKLRGLREKFILRQAFADKIPLALRSRPKIAYQAPDVLPFRRGEKMRDYVEHLLSPERIASVGLFDPKAVTGLLAKFRQHTLPRTGNRDNVAFILLLSTMLLDEMFVRKERSISSEISAPAPVIV